MFIRCIDGHYLHLPVVSSKDARQVIGMVDVLSLTYHTMEQLLRQQMAKPSPETMGSSVGTADEGQAVGPMWSQFWESAEICSGEALAQHEANLRHSLRKYSKE